MNNAMMTIKKSILIPASKENVWSVLVDDPYNREWYAVFGKTAPKTNWGQGHKVVFTDKSRNGITGKVAAKTPYEMLSIVYDGVLVNGIEDHESELAATVKGAEETYALQEVAGQTLLTVVRDVHEEKYDSMEQAWDTALQRISELAHSQKKSDNSEKMILKVEN
jgi:uncharacterized protein YndB with AHSA1/START domain